MQAEKTRKKKRENSSLGGDVHISDMRGHYDDPKLQAYVLERLVQEPPAFAQIREQSIKEGLPLWQIGPLEGKVLEFLARTTNAKKALEIGTLGGYSTDWIASALPADGRLFTLECDPTYAKIASDNLQRAGLLEKVDVVVGDAAVTLKSLSKEGPFDFCFIDADKVHYAFYLQWAIENMRRGGIVVGDNAFLFGKLHLDPQKSDKEEALSIRSMQEFLKLLSDKEYFSSCAMIPTGEGMAVGIRR